MPLLEDAESIQLGIAQVLHRLQTCDIEYRAAALMLYSYQLAMANLGRLRTPFWKEAITVDRAADPENAGTTTEPLTYNESVAAMSVSQPELKNKTIPQPEKQTVPTAEPQTKIAPRSASTANGADMKKLSAILDKGQQQGSTITDDELEIVLMEMAKIAASG